jgi:cytoskeleton protein RodZ
MSKPGTLPPDESLDARLCAEVGAELRRVRTARGLTIADVGEKLLLSPRQVKALEDVEFAAFHNPTFHLNALKKYAVLAELDSAWQYRLAAAGTKPDPPAAHEENGPLQSADSRRWTVIAVSAVIATLLIGAVAYGLWVRHESPAATPRATSAAGPAISNGSPSATSSQPASVAAGLAAPSASADAVARDPAAFGALKAVSPTWIVVRDAENTITERSLAAGESLELHPPQNYLVVGAGDAERTLAGVPVDVSRFRANGEIRINAGDFDALVQGASPIPAPTPSVVR